MCDLISRQAAITAICEDGTWLESQGCTEITMCERKQRDADILSELPTIEAEQVRHGRWLRGSAYPHHIFCSVFYATYIPNDEIPLWKSESYFNVPRNYCPYCGAKMDGGGYDGNG